MRVQRRHGQPVGEDRPVPHQQRPRPARVGVVEAAQRDRVPRERVGVEAEQLRGQVRALVLRYLLQRRRNRGRIGGQDHRVHVMVEHLDARRRTAGRACRPPRRPQRIHQVAQDVRSVSGVQEVGAAHALRRQVQQQRVRTVGEVDRGVLVAEHLDRAVLGMGVPADIHDRAGELGGRGGDGHVSPGGPGRCRPEDGRPAGPTPPPSARRMPDGRPVSAGAPDRCPCCRSSGQDTGARACGGCPTTG